MDYVFDVTIPADTSEDNAVREDLELTHGIISEVRIGMPDGCADLVHVQIWRFGHQVWPSNIGGSYSWNNYMYVIREGYELFNRPYELWARCWNLDKRNPHTVQIGVSVLSAEPSYLGRVMQAVLGRPTRWR